MEGVTKNIKPYDVKCIERTSFVRYDRCNYRNGHSKSDYEANNAVMKIILQCDIAVESVRTVPIISLTSYDFLKKQLKRFEASLR